jgi:hypothetical protein
MRSHVLVPRTGRLECREETIAVKRSMMLPRCHGMLAPPPRIVRAEQADEGSHRAASLGLAVMGVSSRA